MPKSTRRRGTILSEPRQPLPPPAASRSVSVETAFTAKREKAPTRREIVARISTSKGLTRRQVSSVFDGLAEEIKYAVREGGPGTFSIPGLLQIVVVEKPATKERRVINPFTHLEMVFKALPARRMVKVRPLRGLIELVAQGMKPE